MSQKILLDTGIWAQSLLGSHGLSAEAILKIRAATTVYISPISVYEIGQKCRLGKWNEMLPYLERLPDLVKDQGAYLSQLSPEILLEASVMKWEHRDPFDRIIAATATRNALHVVTTDRALSDYLGSNAVTN